MTAIWRHDGSGWRVLSPTGFPDEKALHDLVEEAPQMLPLAGAPRLTVLGREVLLGGNYADLIAVEPSGRLAVIEIKLRCNAETRRAVVAQILTYAAYLRGLDPATLERDVLGPHLTKRDFPSLAAAVAADDQAGAFDTPSFAEELADSLEQGRFRLVLVLDEAPEELVRLVGYLEAVADKLVIDLVTVAAYDVAGSQVLVPQRVDAERRPVAPASPPSSPQPATTGRYVEGAQDFLATIEDAAEEHRPGLRRLAEWALSLEREGVARLGTYHGVLHAASRRWTLLPYVRGDNATLATVWNDRGPYLTLYRSVFERRAPASLPRVEQLVAPGRVGKGTVAREPSDELLEALTAAYREAAGVAGGDAGTSTAPPG